MPENNKNLLVSAIIPSVDEEKYIAGCLNSIIAQDYPKENLEVFVVDGRSSDRTREIAQKYEKNYGFIKVLDNPKRTTPCAMNIGIKNSKGAVIIKVDAHAVYAQNYISKCVESLQKYNADNVGGVLKTLAASSNLQAKAVAFCLSSFFGSGNSYFRVGSKRAEEADTVAFGCYKREIFDKVGLYNESLARSQDMELNLRIKKAGGKIMLVPEITAHYYPKKNLKDFFLHNFVDGIWSIYPLKFVKIHFSLRHYIPLLFAVSIVSLAVFGFFSYIFFYFLAAELILYFSLATYFSIDSARNEKDIRFIFLIPAAFFARHFGYGLGSIWGIIKLLF